MSKIRPAAAKANKGKRLQLKEHGDQVDYQKKRPVFSLIHVQKSHCITKCGLDEKAGFAEMLKKLSELTWQELYNAPSHGLGCEPIRRLKVKPPQHLPKDTIFVAFRFSGKKPMVGHREKDVFHIIWFDSKFDVYDHGS